VTDEGAAQAAVQTAVAAFGRLDVVVNNAGYGDIAPFEQLSAERFKAVMDTNFYGVVNVTRAGVPLMREQGRSLKAVEADVCVAVEPTCVGDTRPTGERRHCRRRIEVARDRPIR
jgi:NAD(P)-dependent dehydrogenase (short-subunit alcohol dehydrogenase family)